MAVGVRSDESVSKKTRSPTLRAKSCGEPGVAAPRAPPGPPGPPAKASAASLLDEQAPTASESPNKAARCRALRRGESPDGNGMVGAPGNAEVGPDLTPSHTGQGLSEDSCQP